MPLPVTDPDTEEMATVLRQYRTETGRSLLELVDESPVLLIFLRHFGCSFCRQTLEDVSRIRREIEGEASGRSSCILARRSRPNRTSTTTIFRIWSGVSDPEASLYGSSFFRLPRKNVFSQLLVPAVWKGLAARRRGT